MTASTPIWGKLSDLFSKKMLVQTALVDLLGRLAGRRGVAHMGTLIASRALQGLGVGGLTALVQVVIASIVSPRERGRYSGYIGAVFALATVSGPLIGESSSTPPSAGAAASSSACRSPRSRSSSSSAPAPAHRAP
jgi:MFS family permease